MSLFLQLYILYYSASSCNINTVLAACIVLRNSYTNERSSYSTKSRRARDGGVFRSDKPLGIKEQIMLTMLEDRNADNVPSTNFVITDPAFIDNPIIYASEGFCSFTGYTRKEVENRNCRFLQGVGTDQNDIKKIRDAINEEREASIELLNYKKDGTAFRNQFFLCPLLGPDKEVAYYMGVQKELTEDTTHSQERENAGYRLFNCL